MSSGAYRLTSTEKKLITQGHLWWALSLFLIVPVATRLLNKDGIFFARWIESEHGLIENATVVALVLGAVFSLIAAVRFWRRQSLFLGAWFGGVSLVCIGFAGEEASWGQHWFGWETPRFFAEHNSQNETNIHNMNGPFERAIKMALTIMVVIGGLILPLIRRNRRSENVADATVIDWISGTGVCIPVVIFVLGVRLVERLKVWFDLDWALIDVNLKELQELYIAIFLLVYAWSVKMETEHMKHKNKKVRP